MTTGNGEPPGLQAERTRLSWRRTSLSATAAALLAVVAAARDRPNALIIAAVVALWALALGIAHRRVTALDGVLADAESGAHAAPAALALTVAALAVVGIVSIVDLG